MELVKLNRNGQVSIPASLRKRHSLKQGDLFRVEESSSGKIILTPVAVTEKTSVVGLDLKKYAADGVDISLISSNLKMTPTERLRNNKKMLDLIDHVQKKSHPGIAS